MASLLHCMVPQLVARSGASAVRQRTMATLSSPSSSSSAPAKATTNAVKGAAGKVSGSNTTTATVTAAKAATPPPASTGAAAAEENPLWILWRDHKNNKWAIGTVLVAALMGDAAVSWALFGKKNGDEEGQEGVKEAIAQAEKVANTSVAATVA